MCERERLSSETFIDFSGLSSSSISYPRDIPLQRFQRVIAGNRINTPYNTQSRSIVTRRRETVWATWRFIVPSFPLKHLGWLPADVAIGRSTWLFRGRILNYLAPSSWLCVHLLSAVTTTSRCFSFSHWHARSRSSWTNSWRACRLFIFKARLYEAHTDTSRMTLWRLTIN